MHAAFYSYLLTQPKGTFLSQHLRLNPPSQKIITSASLSRMPLMTMLTLTKSSFSVTSGELVTVDRPLNETSSSLPFCVLHSSV